MRSAACALRHRVTHYTLCPLGEPEIAIGHEPRIEPWLTANTSLACRSFELDGIATLAEENYEHGLQAKLPHGSETTVGWISRHKPRPPVEAELFFLTSLFIELIDPFGQFSMPPL